MSFQIKLESEALEDIQDGIDWYSDQEVELGRKFYTEVKEAINLLRESPFFQIRYDQVRCLPLKKFLFMIHYTLNEVENRVIIRAIFHTLRDPDIWKSR